MATMNEILARKSREDTDIWSGSEPIETGWLDRHPSSGFLLCFVVVSSMAIGAGIALRVVVGVAVAVALALALVVLRKPSVGGYILVGVVPITSGFLPGVPVPHLRLSEVLIVGIAAIVLLSASARQTPRWQVLDLLVLVYVVVSFGIGTMDVFRDHDHKSFELFGTLAGPLQFLLLYRTVAVALPRLRQRNMALRIFFLASIPVSLLAVLQQLRLRGVNDFIAKLTGSSIFQSYSYHAFARATGPFDHWTPLAGYLLVILILGISLNVLSVDGIMSRRAMFIILVLDTVGMLLSAELSAMAALAVGGLALGVWSGRVRLLARWAVPVVIGVSVLFGSYFVQRLHTEFGTTLGSSRKAFVPQTLAYRWQVWTQQYFPAIRSRLTHGYGPVLPSTITWPDTESQYVTYLMWGGVPLLMTFIAMMWALYHRARLLVRPVDSDRSMCAMARALVVLIIAIYLIDTIFPYFTSSGLPQAFWVLVGVLLAAEHEIFSPRLSGKPPVSKIDYDVLAEEFTPV